MKKELKDKLLTLKEKMVLEQFVDAITRQFQKFQNCQTYEDVEDTMLIIENYSQTSKRVINFTDLCEKIEQYLNENRI